MTDTPRKIAEAATQILADVRAGNHPHGDIRDAGRILNGKWDQDFPTAILGLGQVVLSKDGELKDANSLARRAILGLARVRGMLEEGTTRAAILRTESVYVPAPMAREFIALAKELQAEDEARADLDPDNASQEIRRG